MNSVKAVLFDFDLTLADSSAGIIESTQYALRKLNLVEEDSDRIRSVIGLPLQKMFVALCGTEHTNLAEEFARLFVERADEVMVSSTRLYPEVPGLLLCLRDASLKVGIVSSKFRYRINAILEANQLADFVDVVVGGEDVVQHKPHPEAIALALRHLELEPAFVVYVGDHVVDAQAAESAGTGFLGVSTGLMTRQSWTAIGKQCVSLHVGEVAELIAQTPL